MEIIIRADIVSRVWVSVTSISFQKFGREIVVGVDRGCRNDCECYNGSQDGKCDIAGKKHFRCRLEGEEM